MMDNKFIPLVLSIAMAATPILPAMAGGVAVPAEQSRGTSSSKSKKSASAKKSAASAKKPSSPAKKSAAPAKKTGTASKTKTTTAKRRNKRGTAVSAGAASSESAAEMKRQQEAAQREITATKQQLKETDVNIKKGVDELGRLQGDIGDAKKKVEAAASEVSALDTKIQGLETKVAAEEKQLDKLRTEYLKAIKKMRVAGKNTSALAFVFSSGSFHQALRRMRYLKEFSEWKERQSAQISKTVEHLRQQRDLLAKSRTEKDAALRRQQVAHKELQGQYARQDAIVVELRANREALNSHLAKKQAEANTLKSRISALIAAEEQARRQREEAERRRQEEIAAAERRERQEREERERKAEQERAERLEKEKAQAELAASSKKDGKKDNKKKDKESRKDSPKKNDSKAVTRQQTASKERDKNRGKDYADARKRKPRSEGSAASGAGDAAANHGKPSSTSSSGAGSFEKMRGSLPRPVNGAFRITSPFGRHALPELPDVMYDNPGIDAQVAAGATAQAVYGGKVSGVYMIPGFSTVVIVNHGNYYTVYGNIASPSVKVGDSVKQGQAVGRLAVDEDDPGHSSIHFEVWRNREKLNPSEWIR